MIRYVLALFLLVSAGLCQAADIASLNIIGFSTETSSREKKYFAFEEYGVQDGSGFPYSNIFIIDIAANKFVEDTPVRILIKQEESISVARKASRAKVSAALERLNFVEDPGELLVFNPVSELDSDPHKVRFSLFQHLPSNPETMSLTLNMIAVPLPAHCKDRQERVLGFKMVSPDMIVHEDKSLPESRGCPSGYAIGAIIAPFDGAPRIAMIRVYQAGFEGLDGRWIAVPF